MIQPTLTLERNGKVDVQANDHRRKCGPAGANTIEYRILAECADKLDRDGFLIDHNTLADYMESTFSNVDSFPSCELIADKSCRDIWRLLHEHGAQPIGLTITVAAFGQAGVTAKYRREGVQ